MSNIYREYNFAQITVGDQRIVFCYPGWWLMRQFREALEAHMRSCGMGWEGNGDMTYRDYFEGGEFPPDIQRLDVSVDLSFSPNGMPAQRFRISEETA